MKEIWKPIGAFDSGYEVSNLGGVRSLNRTVIGRNYKGRTLRQTNHSAGYKTVSVLTDRGRTMVLVHRLVAIAFIPNPDSLLEVNHKDGNKANANVINLEWCTHSQNLQHSYDVLGQSRLGRTSGEKHYNCKFSNDEIAEIRAKKGTASTRAVGKQHNTSSSHISLIWNNKTRKQCQPT